MKKVNWGIVGLGRIAGKFAQDIRFSKQARLHAVASRNQKKAEEFGEQYGVLNRYGSYNELLTCPDLDVVYISTPHIFHCENTITFLKKGIGVLVEKPAGMNRKEVERMVACSKAHNTFFMEAMWTSFFPLIHKAISVSKSGLLGNLKTLKADFGFHQKFSPNSRVHIKELGGGGILDVGIYPLFLSLLIFGKPKSIIAKSTFSKTGVDESTHILLEYDNNKVAQLFCSINDLTEVEATLFGDSGKLKLHSRFHHPKKISYGKYYESETVEFHNYPGFGYHLEVDAVCNDIQNGRTENQFMTHQLSLDLAELLDKVRAAAGVVYDQDGF